MKTIGLIGGMSWESTAEYYRLINQRVREHCGGLHSARCLLWSFDFADMEQLQRDGDWARATQRMIDAACALARGGADFLVICTNTMHKMAADVEAAAALPVLHVADATAARLRAAGLRRAGLLATRFTMEEDFYRGRLQERHGLEVAIPAEKDRQFVHDVIYNELCCGVIRDESRREYAAIIRRLGRAGAEGVILGCTEVGLLIRQEHSELPVFDTTVIHAEAAADYALDRAS